MKEEHHKWYSNYLSRDFDMLTFGHSGLPVILFPTSNGRYYENKDCHLVDSAAEIIESGKVKLYCPDGVDADSWYNYSIAPEDRVKTHNGYENLILNDVIEFAKHDSGFDKVAVAGCSFGGYHALNLALRHPKLVSHIITMSGSFDIKQYIMGFYDDNCYYNNPPDYLPGLKDPAFLKPIKKMGIILGTGDKDICLEENLNLSTILREKGIEHWLDVVPRAKHDWPYWREMFPRYLENITMTRKS
jgi:esterase/lipase superfamily enzyme